jgi:hypothetical protein
MAKGQDKGKDKEKNKGKKKLTIQEKQLRKKLNQLPKLSNLEWFLIKGRTTSLSYLIDCPSKYSSSVY